MCLGAQGVAVANPATTAGSNKTAFNGSGAANNTAWNSFANPRASMNDTLAKADFGNCESVIMRCVMPKCSNGGCLTMEVARPLVTGCINSNASCKAHGQDLIEDIAARVVAQSTSKAAAQKNAADAAAAQAQADNAQVEALQQQLSQLQNQMAVSAGNYQSLLEQQKNDNAAAMAELTASVQQSQGLLNPGAKYDGTIGVKDKEKPLTDIERIALQNGVDTEVMARNSVLGGVVTNLENAQKHLSDMKKAMDDVFVYAGCDGFANHCSGPKRVKRFKDLANKFFEPYDGLSEELETALEAAMGVGLDVSDALLVLNGACKQWGYYICNPCDPETDGESLCSCADKKTKTNCYFRPETDEDGKVIQKSKNCRLTGFVKSDETVRLSLLDNSMGNSGAERIACSGDVLISGYLGKGKKKPKLEGLENLQRLIEQDASRRCKADTNEPDGFDCGQKYCAVPNLKETKGRYTNEAENMYNKLEKSVQQKKLLGSFCLEDEKGIIKVAGKTSTNSSVEADDKAECVFFPAEYALCTVHAYNIGKTKNSAADTSYMQDVIALKSTVIAQQMKEQYDLLNAIAKRLTTQIEKSVYTTQMDILAGADSSSGSSSSNYSSNSGVFITDAENCAFKTDEELYTCLISNINAMRGAASNTNSVCKQLEYDMDIIKSSGIVNMKNGSDCKEVAKGCSKNFKTNGVKCMMWLNSQLTTNLNNLKKQQRQGSSGGMVYMPFALGGGGGN